MIGLPIIFVIISFIVYKKYYKLNSEYMTRIMNILSLKKEENKVEENNQNKELKEVNYANSIS
jgi:melibiose permease